MISYSWQYMSYGYEVPGMVLLQAYLYTYSLLRGVMYKVLHLSSYALSSIMLPLFGNTCGTPVMA